MRAMSLDEMQERVDAVTRVHGVLNARRQFTPMPEHRETMWFALGSFTVLALLAVAALA